MLAYITDHYTHTHLEYLVQPESVAVYLKEFKLPHGINALLLFSFVFSYHRTAHVFRR